MSEPPKSSERPPEREPRTARRSDRTQVEIEDLLDSSSGGRSGAASAGTLTRSMKAALLDSFERARAALSMREDNFFLLLSVIIGLFAGLAVVCFRISIDYTRLWLLGSGINPGPVRVLLVPTAAGLLLAFIVLRIFPRVKGSGVTQTKSAVYIYDGYIPFDTVIGKFLTCALAIGSGCFLAMVGAYVVAYVRNSRLFSSSSMFGRRNWRRRVKIWPKDELAELRFQRVDWGGSVPRLMYLFIGRDHHLLFRLEPNFWDDDDVRRFADSMGVKVVEAPPATSKAFQKEFPEAMPPWMAHTRMRTVIWAAFFLVTLIILPVLLAIVLPRLP